MSNQQSCDRVLGMLDSYMDGELTSGETAEVTSHLDTCEACAQQLETRRAIRNRLKTAVAGVQASSELRAAIQQHRPAHRPRMFRMAAAIAAALAICFGAAIAYQRGHLRLTAGSKNAYIAAISAPIPAILRAGLADHVNCAVYKAFPNRHPTSEQMSQDLGRYKELAPIVATQIPAGYRLQMAHQCTYRGRRFVHLTFTSGSALVSLVISRRQDGESFERDQLIPVLNHSGIAIYQTQAQRFAVSAFETPDSLVYVISNLDARDNLKIIMALAAPVRSYLESIQG